MDFIEQTDRTLSSPYPNVSYSASNARISVSVGSVFEVSNGKPLKKALEFNDFGLDIIGRNQQGMLDSDLAMLYQVETKRLNEAMKRNIERFPEEFGRLIREEMARKQIRGLIRFLVSGKGIPAVFTRNNKALPFDLVVNTDNYCMDYCNSYQKESLNLYHRLTIKLLMVNPKIYR